EKGDVVGIYMPMIPETPAAMLACARIGATHNVVFGGFSAEAVRERMEVSDAKVLVTCNTSLRRGKPGPMKESVDEIAGKLAKLEHVVVDVKPETDVYWCAADIGWVTGHSYIVYGPLSNGLTSVMYEGAPDYPD